MTWNTPAANLYLALAGTLLAVNAALILYALLVRAGIVIRNPRIWRGKEQGQMKETHV